MSSCAKRWDFMHVANELIFEQSLSNSKLPNREFQPGDVVVSRGSLYRAYTDFLQQQNLALTPFERQGLTEVLKTQEPFRFCLILQRLPENQFLVCYFTTYGGARTPRAIADPIHRFFALGVSNTQYPPGVPPLRVIPGWNDKKVSFVFTVPAVRKHVFETRHSIRWHVPPAELERLISYVKDRVRVFRDQHTQLRRSGTSLRELITELDRTSEQYEEETTLSTSAPEEQSRTMFDWAPTRLGHVTFPKNSLKLPQVPIGTLKCHHDLRWLYRSFDTDILYRSSHYLNSLKKPKPRLQRLPRPYYSPSLRASARVVSRLMKV